jgi:hypothetical protein
MVLNGYTWTRLYVSGEHPLVGASPEPEIVVGMEILAMLAALVVEADVTLVQERSKRVA